MKKISLNTKFKDYKSIVDDICKWPLKFILNLKKELNKDVNGKIDRGLFLEGIFKERSRMIFPFQSTVVKLLVNHLLWQK